LLHLRLISAAIILAALLALVLLDYWQVGVRVPGAWLVPALLGTSLLATGEVLHLVAAKGHRPLAWPVFAGNAALPLAASAPVLFALAGRNIASGNSPGIALWPMMTLVLAALLVIGAEMHRFRQPGAAVVHAALGVFTLVYIGLLVSFLALLRLHGGHEWGMLALVSVLAITKLADTGAYFVGRSFGRHKMTPLLSPGKTWEGAVGGVLTACLASWALFQFVGPIVVRHGYVQPPLAAALAYGLVLAAAGMHGDLAESLLKRDASVKDSSDWMPGFGGVLDLLDSILFAGPVAYIWWAIGFLAP
jgi:phosphatidate cytidylyltransferase